MTSFANHPVDVLKDITGWSEAEVAGLREFCDEPAPLSPGAGGVLNMLQVFGVDPEVVNRALQRAVARATVSALVMTVARRQRLYDHAPRCPKCRTAQVQLQCELPARWMCGKCGQGFIYEPIVVSKADVQKDECSS